MNLLPRKLALVKSSPKRRRSLRKGLVAGLVGGIAGTAAKTIAWKLTQPRDHAGELTVVSAERATDHSLPSPKTDFRHHALHWGIGAAVGAAYGAAAEFYPDVTAKEGVNFGMALMAATHEGALPAIGLKTSQQPRDHASELASHVVYGVATEIVRRIVRRAID
jgi:putative membrane protein